MCVQDWDGILAAFQADSLYLADSGNYIQHAYVPPPPPPPPPPQRPYILSGSSTIHTRPALSCLTASTTISQQSRRQFNVASAVSRSTHRFHHHPWPPVTTHHHPLKPPCDNEHHEHHDTHSLLLLRICRANTDAVMVTVNVSQHCLCCCALIGEYTSRNRV